MINKDTVICCSFSGNPSNRGCNYFNTRFARSGMNWVYKAFHVNDIGKALDAMRTLGFRGAGISMPFKVMCLQHVDDMSEEVKIIGAANTVVNDGGRLTAYNTDYLAAKKVIEKHCESGRPVVILGNGGLSKAVQYVCDFVLFRKCEVITRDNWYRLDEVRDQFVINCTPLTDLGDIFHSFFDCVIGTPTGDEFAEIQSAHQFNLYTRG